MDSWHLYLVRCADDSLYCGIATDVARRFEEHRRGVGARYLRGRGPLELVLQGAAGDRSTALRLEARIKRLTKAAKEELVRRPRRLAALRAELEREAGEA
jgi:putative endonuclease